MNKLGYWILGAAAVFIPALAFISIDQPDSFTPRELQVPSPQVTGLTQAAIVDRPDSGSALPKGVQEQKRTGVESSIDPVSDLTLGDSDRTLLEERLMFLEEVKPPEIGFFENIDPQVQVVAPSYVARINALKAMLACHDVIGQFNQMQNPDYLFPCLTDDPDFKPFMLEQARCVIDVSTAEPSERGKAAERCFQVNTGPDDFYDVAIDILFEEVNEGRRLTDDGQNNFIYSEAKRFFDSKRYGHALENFGYLKYRVGQWALPYYLATGMTNDQIQGVFVLRDCLENIRTKNQNPDFVERNVELAQETMRLFTLTRPQTKDLTDARDFSCLAPLDGDRRMQAGVAFSSQFLLWGMYDSQTIVMEDFFETVRESTTFLSDYKDRRKRMDLLAYRFAQPFQTSFLTDDADRFILADVLEERLFSQPGVFGLSKHQEATIRKAFAGGTGDCTLGAVRGLVSKESLAVIGGTYTLQKLGGVAHAYKYAKTGFALQLAAVAFSTGAGGYFLYESSKTLTDHWNELDLRGKISGACGTSMLALVVGHSSQGAALATYKSAKSLQGLKQEATASTQVSVRIDSSKPKPLESPLESTAKTRAPTQEPLASENTRGQADGRKEGANTPKMVPPQIRDSPDILARLKTLEANPGRIQREWEALWNAETMSLPAFAEFLRENPDYAVTSVPHRVTPTDIQGQSYGGEAAFTPAESVLRTGTLDSSATIRADIAKAQTEGIPPRPFASIMHGGSEASGLGAVFYRLNGAQPVAPSGLVQEVGFLAPVVFLRRDHATTGIKNEVRPWDNPESPKVIRGLVMVDTGSTGGLKVVNPADVRNTRIPVGLHVFLAPRRYLVDPETGTPTDTLYIKGDKSYAKEKRKNPDRGHLDGILEQSYTNYQRFLSAVKEGSFSRKLDEVKTTKEFLDYVENELGMPKEPFRRLFGIYEKGVIPSVLEITEKRLGLQTEGNPATFAEYKPRIKRAVETWLAQEAPISSQEYWQRVFLELQKDGVNPPRHYFYDSFDLENGVADFLEAHAIRPNPGDRSFMPGKTVSHGERQTESLRDNWDEVFQLKNPFDT